MPAEYVEAFVKLSSTAISTNRKFSHVRRDHWPQAAHLRAVGARAHTEGLSAWVEPQNPRDRSSVQVDSSLLTVLTTEHFTLQGARASSISESSARAALYVGAVSSALIAWGFLGQASRFGAAFDAFALLVLPTIYLLGLFTFMRLVQTSRTSSTGVRSTASAACICSSRERSPGTFSSKATMTSTACSRI
jgi:hypothetical protein